MFFFLPFLSFFIDEFKKMLSCQVNFAKYPFNFDCDFVRFYFGKDLKYRVNYQEFTHLLQVRPTYSRTLSIIPIYRK